MGDQNTLRLEACVYVQLGSNGEHQVAYMYDAFDSSLLAML